MCMSCAAAATLKEAAREQYSEQRAVVNGEFANARRLPIQRALLAAGGSNGGVCRLSRHLRAIVKVALRS